VVKQWFIIFGLLWTSSFQAQEGDSILSVMMQAPPAERYDQALELYRFARSADSMDFLRLDASAKAVQLPETDQDQLQYLSRLAWSQWLIRHDRSSIALDSLAVLDEALSATLFYELHARTLLVMAVLRSERGQFDQAIELAVKAKDYAEQVEDSKYLIEILNVMGEQYRDIGAYEKAINYYDQALVISEEQGNEVFSVRMLNNKGIALTQLGRFDEAKAILEEGWQRSKNDGYDYSEAILLTNSGFNAKSAERFEEALDYYTQSLAIKERFGRKGSMAYTLNDIGETYFFMQDYNQAIRYSLQGLALAEEADELVYQRDMSKTLANTYSAMGKFDSAYRYLQQSQTIQNALLNDSSMYEIARVEKEQELKQKQLENTWLQELNVESERALDGQRKVNTLMIILSVFLLLFGFVLWRSNRQRDRYLKTVHEKSDQLDEQNQQLNHLLNEQEALFNIVTHDLKGPLINAQRLLKIEEEADPLEQKKLRKMLKRSVQRSMDFIHEFNTLHAIDKGKEEGGKEEVDVAAMVQDVLHDFQQLIEEKKLSIHLGNKQEVKVLAVKSYVHHILQNLISNAVKYSPLKGSIFITLTQKESLRISIENQGHGIEADELERVFERFYRGSSSTPEQPSSGLGLALVKLLVDRMGGKIKVKSVPGERTEFIATLPNR
jgi:signal transduction histidine kinase